MSAQPTPEPLKVGKPFVWHRREFLPIVHDGKVSKPTVALVIDDAPDWGLQDHHRADAAEIVRRFNVHAELLEAAQGALKMLAHMNGPTDQLRAAIAKATGPSCICGPVRAWDCAACNHAKATESKEF